jgi:hypothetical protein
MTERLAAWGYGSAIKAISGHGPAILESVNRREQLPEHQLRLRCVARINHRWLPFPTIQSFLANIRQLSRHWDPGS